MPWAEAYVDGGRGNKGSPMFSDSLSQSSQGGTYVSMKIREGDSRAGYIIAGCTCEMKLRREQHDREQGMPEAVTSVAGAQRCVRNSMLPLTCVAN